MKTPYLILFSLFFFTSRLLSQIPDSLKYQSLAPAEFQKRYNEEKHALLIDVREPFEIKNRMIKGAVNIPVSGGIAAAADTIDKATSLFIYCTSGVRSRRISVSFYEKGFRNLYSLKGGINAWKKEGLSVVRAGKQKKGRQDEGEMGRQDKRQKEKDKRKEGKF